MVVTLTRFRRYKYRFGCRSRRVTLAEVRTVGAASSRSISTPRSLADNNNIISSKGIVSLQYLSRLNFSFGSWIEDEIV